MTAPPPPTGFRPALVRALPRVTGATLGLGLAVAADNFSLAGVGFFVLLVSVDTKPTAWWQYVRTGTKPVSPPAAEYTEPGHFRVEMLSPGARPFEVMKALRDVTAVDAVDARIKVESTPVLIAEQLSATSARRVCGRLERAGATATVDPPPDPGETSGRV